MKLLEDFMHNCVVLQESRIPDGAGGCKTTWTEGVEIKVCLSLDASMEARKAEKEGVKSVYSALVNKDVDIKYGDYFKDKAAGITYRVTSNPSEKQAPKSSTFNFKFFTAERKAAPK